MEGLVRRLVYDPNVRTLGSVRELGEYISSTPLASESVAGTSDGLYGRERELRRRRSTKCGRERERFGTSSLDV